MPRRSRAAFHSGCSCRPPDARIDSSICSGGRTSAHDVPAVHLAPGDRDDHLGHVGLGALQQDEADPAVRPPRPRPRSTARTSSLGGSHRPT